MVKQLSLETIALDKEDVCSRKHQGAETSVLANAQVDKLKDRALIFSYIHASRHYGMTLDELCIKLERSANCISGRITELLKLHMIAVSNRKRSTRTGSLARVYVAPEYSDDPAA